MLVGEGGGGVCLFIGERPIRVIGVEDGGTLNPGVHCKKRLAIFPWPAGMSLNKLSMAGKKLISPGQGEFVG
jgi:hypothetical protein